jgi:acyl-CoA dehydrogenase
MESSAAQPGLVGIVNGDGESAAPKTLRTLAEDVRSFLERRRQEGAFTPACDAWVSGWDRAFSRELAACGWVGLTIPERYGGGGRSQLERLMITEELLAAGAPVAAHWVTERQIAPMLMAVGTEEQRLRFLPQIARAEVSFALGMSEPESGSDLASVRTRAVRTDGGWLVSGQKIWTTSAHRAEYVVVLCRTSKAARHSGLSQLIVDLQAPGVEVRPIPAAIGDDEFAEVFFDDAFTPDENVLGTVGEGWWQITTELGYERSGPERFMSNVPLLQEFVSRTADDRAAHAAVGGLVARMVALRALVMNVAAASDEGRPLTREAALAKDAGSMYEQDMVDVLHALGCPGHDDLLATMMNRAILAAPTVTLRGGTTEILRGIIAKDLVGG